MASRLGVIFMATAFVGVICFQTTVPTGASERMVFYREQASKATERLQHGYVTLCRRRWGPEGLIELVTVFGVGVVVVVDGRFLEDVSIGPFSHFVVVFFCRLQTCIA